MHSWLSCHAMDFQEVIRRRKMVRSFDDQPLSREMIDRLIANGHRAPSAGYSQGFSFVVFEGKDQATRFWDVADPDRRWPVPYWDIDTAMASMNVLPSPSLKLVGRRPPQQKVHWGRWGAPEPLSAERHTP